MSDIEDFIASAQFDVERDSASDVIHAATLREWFSSWQAALQSREPVAYWNKDFTFASFIKLADHIEGKPPAGWVPLYTTPQPATTKPIAAVKGWFHGECVVQALDPEAVLPAGMALYAAPQPVVSEGKWINLYNSANLLVCHIGAHGEIDSRNTLVHSVMGALGGIDGGEFIDLSACEQTT